MESNGLNFLCRDEVNRYARLASKQREVAANGTVKSKLFLCFPNYHPIRFSGFRLHGLQLRDALVDRVNMHRPSVLLNGVLHDIPRPT